ncbi:hypothetical protein SPRG_10937 [Saprolegnia parasitica CBS 223.65]|uniref:Probable pectate lyase F n=1 Tax=Saprolegnia parasitica (strain CBS 223.65) TaxID=695850 RepID=A0A067BV21_SAPPC|nr:hypothetical protein SPRG_10937 [Saprolegnia parasitica CBS 223.65]KDO22118.1 hypothetical protein SPRG_10937 [Saprolegnia parasitica CBS 223.65]|eukprot:XP_012207157.1 hypothetical protein SPRG_10937 [Saprolegnia parasitica CBS 223.65]
MATYPSWPDDLFGEPVHRSSAPLRSVSKLRPPSPTLVPVVQDGGDRRRLWQAQPHLSDVQLKTLIEPRTCAFQIVCKQAKATRKCYHCTKFDPTKTGLYCDACFDARHPAVRMEHSWSLLEDDELDEEKQWLAHLARHKMAQDYKELELLLGHTTSFLASSTKTTRDNNRDEHVEKAFKDMKAIDHNIRELMHDVKTQLRVRNLPQAIAVRKIQDMWKVRKARNRLKLMIQSIYAEMVDPTSGQVYYLNKRTHQVRWDKPKALQSSSPKRRRKLCTADAALYIQRAFRSMRARKAMRRLLRSVYVKLQDPMTGNFYYYNKQTKTTSWTKPKLLGSEEFEAPRRRPLTPHVAASMIQRMLRCAVARRHLRRLLSRVYQKIYEPSLGRHYYYNVKTKHVTWTKPRCIDDAELLTPRSFAQLASDEDAAARQQRLHVIRGFSLDDAASYVQRRVRVHQARARLRRMAQEAYVAILDPTSGAYFYHNTRTGVVSWSRPAVLGKALGP